MERLSADYAGNRGHGGCDQLDLRPGGLVTGGFSGLAIVIKQLSQMLFGKGVPLWVTNLVLNIPLFLFGIRMSRDFLVKTIFGTLMNTFWFAVLPVLQRCRMTGCSPHFLAAF